jgi:hypothetical protein
MRAGKPRRMDESAVHDKNEQWPAALLSDVRDSQDWNKP